ncbi:MAG: response regulator [Mesorhizobium sp.]|uniref:Response regulator n=1 Tax=Aquamicrobium zhengzhouense TaxID=2781738 RepID=A0ABS0S8P8_9HYPH|nr:response regulator [Aquamicrobium zhengzhouense]MBI1619647.1 response regulator [Aquamicrobium zhengzhouense]
MPTASHQPQTILVVEDDVLIRIDIAGYLRGCGWHVIEAGNAAEAVAALESDQIIDLVFSDIQMPGAMDGFGLAAWVREHRPGLRIILTSGVVQRTEAATSLCDEGPIGKPYDHDRLAERIRHHLEAAATGSAGA